MDLLVGYAESCRHHLVALAYHLHIAVLDAVVDHFDEVSGAVFSDPLAAGLAVIGAGCDFLEDGLYAFPRLRRTAGHNRRPSQCAFFAARYAGADIEQPFFFDFFASSNRIGKMTVTAVDDNIALVHKGQNLLDNHIDRLAGLDHNHHFPRRGYRVDKIFYLVCGDDVFAFCPAFGEPSGFLRRAVKGRHGKALAFHIQDEVFTHYSQAPEPNVCFCHFVLLLQKLIIDSG
ncbi:hypothetical protein ES703_91567 [subsurface metagenome]